MENYPHHQSLRLQNFTAFQDATFDFVPGINVLIGENGVGKTHVLKVLYGTRLGNAKAYSRLSLLYILGGIFQLPEKRSESGLRTSDSKYFMSALGENGKTQVTYVWDWHEYNIYIDKSDGFRSSGTQEAATPRPVFIPAIDMMGHTRRFLQTYDELDIDFDLTHRDIVALLLSPERRENADNGDKSMAALAELLGGTVEEEGERFFLNTPQGRQPMPLVAEGLRKIATLYQLYRNGFLRPGATLFWDEPENNLNPILMDEVVRALLALARSGVQIFLATHSYFVLRELDLQAGLEDSVQFFSLEKTSSGTKVHTSDDYAQLSPNLIADQFDYIYDREITRATGRPRRK